MSEYLTIAIVVLILFLLCFIAMAVGLIVRGKRLKKGCCKSI